MVEFAGRRALVTGGAGFIGSHLCEALLADGWSVTVIDDLSTGRWQNVAHLEGRRGFAAIVASATEQGLIDEQVRAHDVVFHLASAVGVKLVIERPVQTVETIYRSADNVLRACARYRRRVLLTSTSEVYGRSVRTPFREDDDVVMGPTEKRRWGYACAKALDEFLALAHHHESGLPAYVVRLFNTVGPRQTSRYGMVLPTFVEQALAGRPLTVFGDGQQSRCFCSVFDVVDALKRLPLVPEAVGHVVNIGSQEEVTIRQLADRVIARLGSSSRVELVPYERAYGAGFDDMQRRIPALDRASQYLGWAPKRTLDEIIDSVAADVRSRGDGR